jgi:TctA family transporter
MEDRRMICPPSSGSQYPLAPVLGGCAEDAFRLSMIGARGDLRMFGRTASSAPSTTLALVLPLWPMIGSAFDKMKGLVATKKPAA